MMENKPTSHILKGLIIVVLLIALDLIFQSLKAAPPMWVRFLPMIIIMSGVAASVYVFSKQICGLNFKESFVHGLKTTAVVTCLFALYTYIAAKFIYPPLSKAEIEAAVQELLKAGNLTPDEARSKAVESGKMMWVIMVSGVIFVSLINGLIGSLIGAAISKKNQ